MTINERLHKTITEFINREYKSYSQYVLSSRAIPSIIDGLKPSQRKILYTAIKTAKNKMIKTASLSGNTISQASYHHGDASLNSAISAMAADWNNNLPLLEGEGNFGSRIINEPAAARYTFCKLHDNFEKYFVDNDILRFYKTDDPEDPEPRYYLPLIPWVLINGVKGIAIGHSTEILPRNPAQVKKLCADYMSGKNIDNRQLLPWFKNFKGEVEQVDVNKYICRGKFERVSGTVIRIVELPIGIEREKYIDILNKLEDDNKIVSYDDECSKSGFQFSVKLKRSTKISDRQIYKMFKLEKGMSENLTVIDENGNLAIFDSAIEILKYFCDWRVDQLTLRYDYYLERDTELVQWLVAKKKFIELVNDGDFKMKNKSTTQLKNQLKTEGFIEEYWPRLLSMRIQQFSQEHINDLKDDIKKIMGDIEHWRSISKTQAYIEELKGL